MLHLPIARLNLSQNSDLTKRLKLSSSILELQKGAVLDVINKNPTASMLVKILVLAAWKKPHVTLELNLLSLLGQRLSFSR